MGDMTAHSVKELDKLQLLTALTALKAGDLTVSLPLDCTGIDGEIARTMNDLVALNRRFVTELGRVTTNVGKEGKLHRRASLAEAEGSWSQAVDSVNELIDDLVWPTTEMSRVIGAVANGDLSQTIGLDVDQRPLRGEFLRTAKTVNTMVSRLSSFADEVTRVAREVGTDGKLGGQADVKDVAGTWKDLTNNVNLMASNLTAQVRNIAEVATAIANGNLAKKITAEARGEILELKNTINIMVDRLNSFASEVTRVAREVGTEGKLGGQAEVEGVAGTWKDLTDNVNLMASNLTAQVRNIAEVTTAVANGDLAKKITAEARGEILELKNTINIMVDRLNSFASEVTRVAREVGTEGKLGGQAEVRGVAGTWKDLTDNVNLMASNLTGQVRNIAEVTTAVANGDLSKKVTVDVRGEIYELKQTINTMVDQLSSFASEVTRVAREVGTEGKLGGQADVRGVAGTWKDLTDNVNLMANNLTGQVRNIAEVTTAVANGDLSKKITVDVKGEILELKNTINTMVDQLNSFASEVTRVAREVGTEGKLGGQAEVEGVAGTWKDLTDNVNLMASNLTDQVRNIAQVTTAVAKGDLSKKITVDVKGEILEMKNTINTMVDQLNSFASEVTRVAREVGTEGKLGGQAEVEGVAGTWKDLTDNVNLMASNLTGQVRNIAEVTTAVANGDLGKKITVDVRGEIFELKQTINTMVDQLSSFASEVTRVAREVGTEGNLGGQAEVKGVAGTWKDLTDNVNLMASNLTGQVRNIAEVTTAVANGDLSKKITVDVKGEILELKNTINTMVDQLSSFASEVTRVAREVGTEGNLGGQAEVKGVAGTWKDLTDNVNLMASNLTGQVRNIAEVTTAVANGDLSKKITVDVKGEILELKNTINTMVDQLSSFASEVTRVAREVGSEGKLGGQADVKGVSGVWKDLTDNVNSMGSNLTAQVRNIAQVTTAVAYGDLSKKITVDVRGEFLQLKDTMNTMVDQLRSFASEVTRVAREVGTEGKLAGQAYVPGVAGTWKDLTDNVNSMAGNLTAQVRNIAQVTTAVANGDLSKKITVDVKGEILELKNTINTMVDQLNSFASEVTRVAREVGTEGKLGGQAQVKGVSGTWKDLTDNVNMMAANLTSQVRGIAKVVTSVATGDLKQKLAFEAKGEIAALADTINGMIDTLATFADQVTTVARLVGVEGKLGGQASVPGAAGTWKALTDNVNQLAANLTTQVRAIAEVATAVTKGDLTRSIQVAAQGEVEALKDNINQMIANLRETTLKNAAQDWLKTNLAKFTQMLQGQKDLLTVARRILAELAPVVSAQQGVFYLMEPDSDESVLRLKASYAFKERKHLSVEFRLGEGLVGQCALERERILLTDVPPDYVQISSGLGQAPPLNLIVLPVLFEGNVKAVIELASFNRFSHTHQIFLEQLTESIGIVLNTIEANMRTERLLMQSQSLAHELQQQQEELRQTNEELEEKARLLEQQNAEVERKNREVEHAKRDLEEKAAQLSLTSRYKSEFLANMSHELRTPLNSLLILANLLSENPEGNLSSRQQQFAKTIYSAGMDLLTLINDILDLTKIESGTVTVEPSRVMLHQFLEEVDRSFRHVADARGLEFRLVLDQTLPRTLRTDPTRLHQVLKNLLSNAFKFTDRGEVELRAYRVSVLDTRCESLIRASAIIAFAVRDTGVGVPRDKQQLIFEAFQQVDGTTSRKYGGTGLGLSISREIAQLLGGEIRCDSEVGAGSTFTLYLPLVDGDRAGTERGFQVLSRPFSAMPAPAEKQDREVVMLAVGFEGLLSRRLQEAAEAAGFTLDEAASADEALAAATECAPAALAADLGSPACAGLLERLADDPALRRIPTLVACPEDQRFASLLAGAVVWVDPEATHAELLEASEKVARWIRTSVRRVLVVGGDDAGRQEVMGLVAGANVEVMVGASQEEASVALASGVECVVALPDGDELPAVLFERQGAERVPPVLLFTEGNGHGERQEPREAPALPVRVVATPDALVEQLDRLLHRGGTHGRDLPEPTPEVGLVGRTVLIVDDDVRNIFALTCVLERYGMEIASAENGKDALALLRVRGDIDAVLMDIMMPDLDGYETTRAIRNMAGRETLPVIALTAKAMKGDREKCLAAGASAYVAKPVQTEKLLSLLRSLIAASLPLGEVSHVG
ncbi:MAG: hypothetical protein AMXMBFR64_06870 [Myxococcales bacterium]